MGNRAEGPGALVVCTSAVCVPLSSLLCLVLCAQDFAKRAAAACGKDVSELSKSYAGLQAAHAPYFCLDLSFCHTVLTQGFDLSEATPITLVKQVGVCGCDAAHGHRLRQIGTWKFACSLSTTASPVLCMAWARYPLPHPFLVCR